jgi:hypothetical protein
MISHANIWEEQEIVLNNKQCLMEVFLHLRIYSYYQIMDQYIQQVIHQVILISLVLMCLVLF